MEIQTPLHRDYHDVVIGISQIGKAYFFQGHLPKGIDLLKTCLAEFHTEDMRPNDLAKLWLSYSELLVHGIFDLGIVLEDVLAALHSAQNIAIPLGDAHLSADIEYLLGVAHYYDQLFKRPQDFTQAQGYLQHAEHSQQALQNTERLSMIAVYSGLIAQFSGDVDHAMQRFQDGHALALNNNHLWAQSYTARHIGMLHNAKNNFENALTYLRRSVELRQAVGYRNGLHFAQIALADTLQNLNQLDEAQKLYQDAIQLAEELQQQRPRLFGLLGLGNLYASLAEQEFAKTSFEQAKQVALAIGHQRAVAHIEEKLTLL